MEEERQFYHPDEEATVQWPDNIEISQLCRICANTSEYLIPIFDGEGMENELELKIKKHLPIQVSKTDTLPMNLCYQCASTLIAWHDLTLGCIEADKRLRDLVNCREERSLQSKNVDCDGSESARGVGDIEIEFEEEVTTTPSTSTQVEVLESTSTSDKLLPTSDKHEDVKKQNQVTEDETIANNSGGEDAANERCPSEVVHEAKILRTKIKQQNTFPILLKEENLLRCSHCGKTFSKKSELATHLSKIHLNNVFHCEPCDTLFHHNKSLFVDHMKWHQESTANSNCNENLGNKALTNCQSEVKCHKKKEIKNITGSNKVDQGLKTIKKELTASYSCEDCGKNFQILSRYNKHIIRHKSSTVQNSDSEGNVSDEQELDVKEGVLYRCEDCGKSFKLKDSYKSHQRKHTGEKPYTCHVCGKRFAHNGGLSYHLKHVHLGIKDHSCDICGRSFAMKAAMEDHRRIHTGERPYICHSCGKTFKTKASLYIHSKTHTDYFPHSCTYCLRRFRWKQQLLGHLTTHTGERNHTCDVCGKRFAVKNDLTRHKKVHSDEKPFSCPVCSFPFAQKRYLKNHMKARHKMKYVDSISGPGK